MSLRALALVTCSAAIAALSWSADPKPADKPKEPPKPAWFELMDFGPFLLDTFTGKAGDVTKGLAIPFGADGKAGGISYDLNLARVSAAWTGAFLKLTGDAYDRKHTRGPELTKVPVFATSAQPGWSSGTGFSDPRSEPFGPLPRTWARFLGLYRHGSQVVLQWSVGNGTVLELPGMQDGVFTRTFTVKGTNATQLLLADATGGTGAVVEGIATLTGGPTPVSAKLLNGPAGAALAIEQGRLVLSLPALTTATFTVAMSAGDAASASAGLAAAKAGNDPSSLIAGGPARWGTPLTTSGSRGKDDAAYAVDTIATPDDNPWGANLRFGGLDFFADGRAALSTWNGDVWIVDGIDDSLGKTTWRRFAAGLHQPLGLKVVDGTVYTLCRDGLWRLKDLNGDGEADFYELFNSDIHATPAFHEFAFDLHTDADGNFYHTKAGPVKQGGRGFETIAEHHGCIIKISKDGKTLERFATGFRAPNGMGLGPNGVMTSGDNEGTWMPVCRLNYIKQGGFMGVMDLAHRATPPTIYDPPICFLPHKVDNSSGAQVWPMDQRWGPLAGNLLHLSYGQCAVFVVAWGMEGNVPQGGVTKLPLGFNTGIMRARVNPKDGQVYVCGLKGWQTTAAKDGGFQRIRATGKPACYPVGMKVHRNGIALTFSDKLDPAAVKDLDNWTGEQWDYLWTGNYGSPEVPPGSKEAPPKPPGKEAPSTSTTSGHVPFPMTAATLSADGRTVFLTVTDLKPVMQFTVKYKISTATGDDLDQTFIGTINVVPERTGP
jgi:hypothetical protein